MLLLFLFFASLQAAPIFLAYTYSKTPTFASDGNVTSCSGAGYWVGSPSGICNGGQQWDPVNQQILQFASQNQGSVYFSCDPAAQVCIASSWNTTDTCDFAALDLTNYTVLLNRCFNFTNVSYLLTGAYQDVSRKNVYAPGGPPSGQLSATINFAYYPNNDTCSGTPQFNTTVKLVGLSCYQVPGQAGSFLFRTCTDPVSSPSFPQCNKANLVAGQDQCQASISHCPSSSNCQGTSCYAYSGGYSKGICKAGVIGDSFFLGCGNSGSFLVPSLTLLVSFLAYFKGF
jgi:hypothetical protein